MCVYTCTCVHVYMRTCVHVYTCTRVHVDMCTCMHACVHTYIHAYICSHVRACVHTRMQACIHTYIHTCTRNTYVHTYIRNFLSSLAHTSAGREAAVLREPSALSPLTFNLSPLFFPQALRGSSRSRGGRAVKNEGQSADSRRMTLILLVLLAAAKFLIHFA